MCFVFEINAYRIQKKKKRPELSHGRSAANVKWFNYSARIQTMSLDPPMLCIVILYYEKFGQTSGLVEAIKKCVEPVTRNVKKKMENCIIKTLTNAITIKCKHNIIITSAVRKTDSRKCVTSRCCRAPDDCWPQVEKQKKQKIIQK